MSYELSDQAYPLHSLRVDADREVSQSHPSMQEAARIAANRHNAAIDLLTGSGDYAADWATPVLDDDGRPVLRDNAAGQFQVHLDSLCIELRTRQSPWSLANPEVVERDILAIVALDKAHPVAKHWTVLADRCVPAEFNAGWPAVEAAMGV